MHIEWYLTGRYIYSLFKHIIFQYKTYEATHSYNIL